MSNDTKWPLTALLVKRFLLVFSYSYLMLYGQYSTVQYSTYPARVSRSTRLSVARGARQNGRPLPTIVDRRPTDLHGARGGGDARWAGLKLRTGLPSVQGWAMRLPEFPFRFPAAVLTIEFTSARSVSGSGCMVFGDQSRSRFHHSGGAWVG